MKKTVFLFALILLVLKLFGENYQISSPDGKVSTEIKIGEKITYQVFFNQEKVLDESPILFTFAQAPPLGNNMAVEKTEERTFDESWKPVLKRYETIRNHYNSIRLNLKEIKFPQREMVLEFRVFNDGVSFRTEFPAQFENREFVLQEELTHFNFAEDHTCWAVNYGSYTTSQEKEFFQRKIGGITSEMIIGLPMTVKVNDNCYAALTEAALDDYAGMYIKADKQEGSFSLRTALSPRKGQPENGEKPEFHSPHYGRRDEGKKPA